jgi:hypothetical protein
MPAGMSVVATPMAMWVINKGLRAKGGEGLKAKGGFASKVEKKREVTFGADGGV